MGKMVEGDGWIMDEGNSRLGFKSGFWWMDELGIF
jgi:hypothetical protein